MEIRWRHLRKWGETVLPQHDPLSHHWVNKQRKWNQQNKQTPVCMHQVWWCTAVIPATPEAQAGESRVWASPAKVLLRAWLKNQKRAGRVCEALSSNLRIAKKQNKKKYRYLPSMYKALGSIPSTTKRKVYSIFYIKIFKVTHLL
jgi:hypothetical protein